MFRRLAAPLLALLLAAAPALAQDAADAVVRLGRVESQMRQMSGQIEQLQFENRQLKEQVRKFQEDVEFRFQDQKGGAAARPAGATPSASAPTPAAPAAPARPGRRGDAFDPGAAPSAPGAPQPLGSTASSGSQPAGAAASSSSAARGGEDGSAAGGPLDLNQLGRMAAASAGGAPAAAAPSATAAAAPSPRTDYDAAYASILQRQYEQAEVSFRQFLQAHPRDKLAPDATFWLGESYLQRSRHREAAEQFLKVSTQYSASAKAPDAMLKLGVSLNALGAREQACATLAELERKYPQASPAVRQGVEREQKRARCTA